MLLLLVIYLSFISLGLPDGLLGSAWPTMYGELGVPLSYAGMISMIIAAGTTFSSLQSSRLARHFSPATVAAASTALTAVALFGFSFSSAFWMLCLLAIPYGLGAGSVDASINNFVALHYSSSHMSWLHCMWGVGAVIGPYIMGFVLSRGGAWSGGYRTVGAIQLVLAAVILASIPLWKQVGTAHSAETSQGKPLSLRETAALPGAKAAMLVFFAYCALEQTAGLWASSYLALHRGVGAETAAFFGSMFFLGITAGRGLSGFLALKLNNTQMIHLGFTLTAVGIAALLLGRGQLSALAGLVLIGLGCAPIYPCMMHATPTHFGAAHSQAMIGLQAASASAGVCLMPAAFGLLANHISVSLMPLYLLAMLLPMAGAYRRLTQLPNRAEDTV